MRIFVSVVLSISVLIPTFLFGSGLETTGTSLDTWFRFPLPGQEKFYEYDTELFICPDATFFRYFMAGFHARGIFGEETENPNVTSFRLGLTWPGPHRALNVYGGFQPHQFSEGWEKAWVSGLRFWNVDHAKRVIVAVDYSHAEKFSRGYGNFDFHYPFLPETVFMGPHVSVESSGKVLAGFRFSKIFSMQAVDAQVGLEYRAMLWDYLPNDKQQVPFSHQLGIYLNFY